MARGCTLHGGRVESRAGWQRDVEVGFEGEGIGRAGEEILEIQRLSERGQKPGKKVINRRRWGRALRWGVGESLSSSWASMECLLLHLVFFPHGPGRFITTKGKHLCAPLHSPWVIRLQERLDASSAKRVRTIPVLSPKGGFIHSQTGFSHCDWAAGKSRAMFYHGMDNLSWSPSLLPPTGISLPPQQSLFHPK